MANPLELLRRLRSEAGLPPRGADPASPPVPDVPRLLTGLDELEHLLALQADPPRTIQAAQAGAPPQSLVDAIRSHRCILFVGAGIHAPPPADSDWTVDPVTRPLLGGELCELLARDSEYVGPNRTLARIAWHYEMKHRRAALEQTVRRNVDTGKTGSAVLRALASFGFPLIVTTNFDRCLERALPGAKSIVYSPDSSKRTPDPVTTPSETAPWILKIHGDVEHAGSLVITDEDYIAFIMRMADKKPFHPVPIEFEYSFQRWPILFVGYSLADYNLRVLFRTLRWQLDRAQLPDTYLLDPYPDYLILNRYGNEQALASFIVQDMWTFVPAMYRQIKGEEMPL